MTRRLSIFSMPKVEDPEILSILQKEAEIRSTWPDVQNRWGLHQFSLGNWEEAKRAFKKALEGNPDYAWASLNLAATNWMMGNREAAWKRHGSTVDFQPAKAVTAAWMHLLEGDLDEATRELLSVAEKFGERPDILWLKTAIAEAEGQDNASHSWHVLLSDSVIMEGPEAISSMKESSGNEAAFGLLPGFCDYWKGVSAIQARLGKFDDAIVSSRLSYIFCSNLAHFLNQMAYICTLNNDEEGAMEFYTQALDGCPRDVVAPQELARYSFAQDDVEQALHYMKIALDRSPTYPDLQREMGQLEAASGNLEEALLWVQKALSANPGFRTAQLEEAYYFFCLSHWIEAAQAYRRSIEFCLQSADVYLHLGRCYEYMGAPQKAEEAYKSSIKLNSREVLAYYRLSLLYQSQDKPTLASDSWAAYEELLAGDRVGFPPDKESFDDSYRPLPQAAA